MHSANHNLSIEQPDYNTSHISQHNRESIVPTYIRERMARAAGQKIVAQAIECRSIDLKSFTPQETIFPDFNNLEETPQTD
jgi:hypothetical protein